MTPIASTDTTPAHSSPAAPTPPPRFWRSRRCRAAACPPLRRRRTRASTCAAAPSSRCRSPSPISRGERASAAWSPASSPTTCSARGYFTPLDKAPLPRDEPALRRRAAASRPGRPPACRRSSPAASRATARAGSRPSSGSGTSTTGQQIDGPAIRHRPDQCPPRRPHHLGRGLHQDHRPRRLLRHAASSSSTNPARRRTAASASPIMDQDGANVRYLTNGDDLGRDAALLAGHAGHHLHVAGQRPAAARAGDQPRDRRSARSSATSPT